MLSDKEKEERRNWIGASEVGKILGVDDFGTDYQVWAEKKGLLEDWKGNEATALGNLFEKPILDYAENELGSLARNVRVAHRSLPLVATLDAQCVDSYRPVEAKTTGLVGRINPHFGEPGTDEVPDTYLVQVYAQLLCTGADIGYLYALIPGRGIQRYEVERNDVLLDKIGDVLDQWWNKYIIGQAVPSTNRVTLDIVKRLKRQPNKIVNLGEYALGLVDHVERLKEIRAEVQDRITQSEKELLLCLGDAEKGTLPDGRSVTYFERTRRSYVVSESRYRFLNFSKGTKNEQRNSKTTNITEELVSIGSVKNGDRKGIAQAYESRSAVEDSDNVSHEVAKTQ